MQQFQVASSYFFFKYEPVLLLIFLPQGVSVFTPFHNVLSRIISLFWPNGIWHAVWPVSSFLSSSSPPSPLLLFLFILLLLFFLFPPPMPLSLPLRVSELDSGMRKFQRNLNLKFMSINYMAQWSTLTKNPDVSTEPHSHLFICLVTPVTHLPCSLCSCSPLRSFVRSLAHSQTRGEVNY